MIMWFLFFSSVQFSRSVVYDSEPHRLQHARLPCPSSSPGACLNSCTASHWCHPTISSSVVPVSSHLPSFPASWSFPISQFFTSGGQSIGVSASASVLPMNTQDWSPLGWTGWSLVCLYLIYFCSNLYYGLSWWLSGKKKNPVAYAGHVVWFLGREDPLEKEMTTHSSIFAWEIPWTEEPCRLQSMELQKSWTQLKN